MESETPNTSAISSVAGPSKKRIFHDALLRLVELGEVGQRIIECNYVAVRALGHDESNIEFDSAISAAFGCTVNAGVVHQNLRLEREPRGQQVRVILGSARQLIERLQMDFAHALR